MLIMNTKKLMSIQEDVRIIMLLHSKRFAVLELQFLVNIAIFVLMKIMMDGIVPKSTNIILNILIFKMIVSYTLVCYIKPKRVQ